MRESPGFLAVWTEIDATGVDEYLAWLATEHLPERIGLAGFESARIHRAADGSCRFFVVYETASPAALGSGEYLARLNSPTQWSRRMHPMLRHTVRGTGEERRFGIGSGVHVAREAQPVTDRYALVHGMEKRWLREAAR